MVWTNPFRKKESVVNQAFINNQVEFTKKMTDIVGRYEAAMKGYQDQITVVMEKNKEYAAFIVALTAQKAPTVKPDFLTSNITYLPKILVADEEKDILLSLSPRDIYTTSTVITEIIKAHNWKELYLKDKQQCAYQIWDFVIKSITYEVDKGENWRYSTTTIYKQTGDCEDGTILFIDLCREAGFRADEIFNGVGYFTVAGKKYCHSFPILNYGDGWYIYESTLNVTPSKPMKLLGSNYTCDYGCANWLFYGYIKGGTMQI